MTQQDVDHIAAYFDGLLSEEERDRFEEEKAFSPEFRKEVDDCYFIWEQSRLLKKQSEFHTYENWNQLQRRIHRDSFRMRLWNGTRTAAAILLLPVTIALFYLFSVRQDRLSVSNEMIKVTSAPGLVSKIVLSDSTQVWLNSGSSIVYPCRFTSDEREVELTGEAYFKVKADEEHRFNVKLPGNMVVSAYGTEFNISAYQDDDAIETVLAKGHVEVRSGNNALSELLEVSQNAVFNKRNGQLSIVSCNLPEKIGWKDGKLVFHKTGILEIAKRLSRRYNADFVIKGPSLDAYHFSATFTSESLSDVLSILEKTAPMKFKIDEPARGKNHGDYSRRKVTLTLK